MEIIGSEIVEKIGVPRETTELTNFLTLELTQLIE